MKPAKNPFILLSQTIIWLLFTSTVLGQAAPPKPLSETEFAAMLESRKKQVDDMSELDDAAKAKVRDLYQQALTELQTWTRWTATTAQNEKLASEAPKELEQTKAALATLPAQPTAAIPTEYTLSQIEQAISKREGELGKLRKALADDETAIKGGATWRAQLSEQISAAKERSVKLAAQLKLPPPSDESSAMNTAGRMVLVTRRRTAELEITCCETQQRAYEARTELLPLHRDLLARQVSLAEQEIKQWQELVNRRRQQEAEQQAQQASWQASQAHPAVQGLLKDNRDLAAMRKELASRIVDTTRQREQVNQRLRTVTDQFARVQEKVDAAGKANVTKLIGLELRKQRDALPNLRGYCRNISVQQQAIGEGQLALQKLQDTQWALSDLDAQTQEVLTKLNLGREVDNRAELQAAVRDALATQRDYLDALIADHNAYFSKLVNLVSAEQQLIKETEHCAEYIDARVLWIASAGPLGSADLRSSADAAWWLAGPDACLDIGRTLIDDITQSPAISALALGLFALLVYWRLRFRARIQEIGPQAAKSGCYRFWPTLEAAMLTTMVAVAWPGLMWYFGWRLTTAADASELCKALNASELCKALGAGLLETARVFLALELLRHICGYRGLAESHFGWPASALKVLRRNIRLFVLPTLSLMCVAVTMAWQETDRWDTSLGRMCFIAALVCFSLVAYRILRPASAVFQAMVAARRGGWLERFRYVWYPLCALTPLALAVLAAAGYHYTARQLVVRLILTAYVLVGGVACRALLLRWTLVNQRKLAIQQARERRAAAQNESNSGEESGAPELPTSTTPDRDLATINIQTRRLIEYSLAVACALAVWCAWIDVLPALNSVNKGLWSTKVTVYEEGSTPNGGKTLKEWTELRETTLADLLLAAIILATTVIAAKNIPGLLEMAVLQHLPFDAGARYAVATVCRYVITIVGLLACFGILGVGWSKVQWLVAAMGLGLGFGLQEIFANFISGLIILFERPVRVGDVVTIGDITGVVSRIHMRATTITDGDRKELIIPNKEFITGRVLNWTLTDPINRVVIRVGIAYGSDTQRAAEILLRLAKDHPNVLDDPAPGVSLESFGDSALNFVLRCFLPNMDGRGTVIHELHMAIDREFREAGIEIAFPQQDVHVRSIDLPQPVFQAVSVGRAA